MLLSPNIHAWRAASAGHVGPWSSQAWTRRIRPWGCSGETILWNSQATIGAPQMKTFTEIFMEEFADWKNNKDLILCDVAKSAVCKWLKQERKVYQDNYDTTQYETISKLITRL
jgi:hypothetical protein